MSVTTSDNRAKTAKRLRALRNQVKAYRVAIDNLTKEAEDGMAYANRWAAPVDLISALRLGSDGGASNGYRG